MLPSHQHCLPVSQEKTWQVLEGEGVGETEKRTREKSEGKKLPVGVVIRVVEGEEVVRPKHTRFVGDVHKLILYRTSAKIVAAN